MRLGRVSSRPPRHFRGALGQMGTSGHFPQSEWAGAQRFRRSTLSSAMFSRSFGQGDRTGGSAVRDTLTFRRVGPVALQRTLIYGADI
jgi:hypothetical protein